MLYLAGTCPVCGTGGKGFRMCGETIVVVMCDECDSIWFDARRIVGAEMVDTDPPRFLLPGTLISLAKSRWATRAEVDAAGWADLIAGEGKAMDEG